jgi:hypothetical protein
MTELEMRKLKVGDVVSFLWDDERIPGTVLATGVTGVSFVWDGGQNGWVDFRDGGYLVKKGEKIKWKKES